MRAAAWQTWMTGLAGSMAVAGLHELSRRLLVDAPRMDVLGEQMIERAFRRFGKAAPAHARVWSWAVGNVGSDTVLYTAVALGEPKRPWLRGLGVGLVAGLGALALPKVAGVSSEAVARTARTQANTVGLYTLAGLAAGLAQTLMRRGRA